MNRIEVGKTYTTRNDQKFRCILIDDNLAHMVSVRDLKNSELTVDTWWQNGKARSLPAEYDIVWHDPTQMQIPWDVIDDQFQWAASDWDGGVYVYETKPSVREGDRGWSMNDSSDMVYNITNVLKFDPGTCDWKDSLQQRPQGGRFDE